MPERETHCRDTCVAIATGSGSADRAVIRISGPRAKDLAALGFVPIRGEPLPKNVQRGTIRGSFRLRQLTAACPCTLWIQTAPHSFTGDDVVESHVPGAPILSDLLLQDLISQGARLAEPGEFTRRAFESGRMDLVKVEATLALLAAEDEAARRHAAAELDGGLSKLIARIKAGFLGVLVPLELQIDFSDQDVEIPVDPAAQEEFARCLLLLRDLAEQKGLEQRRQSAFRVVLMGKANAGKSSLFNRLIGESRAIVSDQRGTTRDVLDAVVRFGGHEIHLFDTAGNDVWDTPADRRAAEHRLACVQSADLVLWVQPMSPERAGPVGELAGHRVLHVATFADLPGG
ncbi:MAG TPA: 50S ribosome-binding GTPase, partial [Planctomycetota bacterium]|nr:50S ribosome-binding GTPase [Planctomycetota bacterium]